MVQSHSRVPSPVPKRAPIGTQLAELKVPCAVTISSTVAISGTTAVKSADSGNDVFTKTAPGWTQTADSGNTIVAGRNGLGYPYLGAAYVFTKTADGWKRSAKLTGLGKASEAPVAISGGTVVVGAPGQVTGRAYVFTRTAAGWRRVAVLKGSGGGAPYFGACVAVSGTTVVVGEPAANGVRLYLFQG